MTSEGRYMLYRIEMRVAQMAAECYAAKYFTQQSDIEHLWHLGCLDAWLQIRELREWSSTFGAQKREAIGEIL